MGYIERISMHVYFVRHGETNQNLHHEYLPPNSPLNETGYDEARTVGEFLRPVNPTLLISSPYVRAVETARIIGQCVGLKPCENHLFREVVWPSKLFGRSLYSFGSLWFIFLSTLYRDTPEWRFRDAENYADMYTRIVQSFAYIDSLTEAHEAIVIVSHSEYIRLMIRYMCHDQSLTLGELLRTLLSVNSLKNGEVVHVEYVGPTVKGTCPWILHKNHREC